MLNGSSKRSLPKPILLWTIVGIVLTIVTAWALAILNAPEMLPEDRKSLAGGWPLPAPADWPPGVSDGSDDTMWGASRLSAQGGDANRILTMIVRTAGFPFRSLAKGERTEYRPQTGVQTPWVKMYGLGWLPLYPLWPGFVINVVIYAALARGLWQIPLAIRRRNRRRAGRCIHCGYSLAGIPSDTPCPECGADLQR